MAAYPFGRCVFEPRSCFLFFPGFFTVWFHTSSIRNTEREIGDILEERIRPCITIKSGFSFQDMTFTCPRTCVSVVAQAFVPARINGGEHDVWSLGTGFQSA